VYGQCDVVGVRRPLLLGQGSRVRSSSKHYQTLPSSRLHHPLQDDDVLKLRQSPRPTATQCVTDRRRVAAHTGNSYGGRLASEDRDDERCNERRRQQMYAASSANLLSSSAEQDSCSDLFGSLHRAGLSLQELPDTHL